MLPFCFSSLLLTCCLESFFYPKGLSHSCQIYGYSILNTISTLCTLSVSLVLSFLSVEGTYCTACDISFQICMTGCAYQNFLHVFAFQMRLGRNVTYTSLCFYASAPAIALAGCFRVFCLSVHPIFVNVISQDCCEGIFFQMWHKSPLGHEDELIRFGVPRSRSL